MFKKNGFQKDPVESNSGALVEYFHPKREPRSLSGLVSCLSGGERPDGSPNPNSIKSWNVIGVVEDFHFANMRENIAPPGLFLERSNGYVAFRFESQSAQE